ncbi:disease resistance protein TAO1-like [Cryptomeria japonica]|uniref:disease resistance protein TAO1-like n=1 Tax=Cryptomeria japonica TaxID=3369 RepID=UPI0027DA729C|nr:disease resistance protein TAO1-like [Cryptomeria japonica]
MQEPPRSLRGCAWPYLRTGTPSASAIFHRFLTASVNADSIKSFQVKIDRLYDDLILWGVTDMEKRLTKIASQSQELYAYQPADIFVTWNIQRQQYSVSPLPSLEARKLLLKNVPEYNDERNIDCLLKLCGGIPLLLEIIGSQLASSSRNTNNNMVLELLREGEVVEEEDIIDRMVDFVYLRLLPPVKEAFLDITSLFCYWPSEEVAYIVGEEEFRALEDATFVKTSEDGRVIVHDIVQARGKKMSEQNRVTDPETLLKCLQDEEKLKNLRGIFLNEKYEHPSIKINDDHLKWMSDSLRVLSYEGSQITFRGKCYKPFRQLRYLQIASNIPDLPMEFEKLEHLSIYRGPLMPGMSFNEFPPSLRVMTSLNLTKMYASSKNRVAYSKIPATKATPDSLLVKLRLYGLKNMERLPDGMENLTKLEQLYLRGCHQLRELPSRFGQLNNLKELRLSQCHELKELPSSIGQLSNLESLHLYDCSALSVLPPSFGDLISLKTLQLSYCSGLKMLPSNFGQLKNLEELDLRHCSGLEEWSLSFRDLIGMKKMVLVGCSLKLKESLPHHIKENCCIVFD